MRAKDERHQTRPRATHKQSTTVYQVRSFGVLLTFIPYLLLELFEPLFLGFQLLPALLQVRLARPHLAQRCLKLCLDVPDVLLDVGYLLVIEGKWKGRQR